MKYFSKIKGQCLITALLVLILLIMPFQDYTEQTFLSDDQNMADQLSDEALMENYYKIVSLSEVPSLLKNGKGQFVCFVARPKSKSKYPAAG